jgi:hypothetical protein
VHCVMLHCRIRYCGLGATTKRCKKSARAEPRRVRAQPWTRAIKMPRKSPARTPLARRRCQQEGGRRMELRSSSSVSRPSVASILSRGDWKFEGTEAVLRAVSLFCSSWPCLIFSDNHHLLSHQTASLFISLAFGCLRVEPGEGGSESSLSQLILTPYAALLKGICRSSGLLSHNAGLGVAAFRI